MFNWNFLCFNFCPVPLVFLLYNTGNSLVPDTLLFSSSPTSHQVFTHIHKILLNLLFSRLNGLSLIMVITTEHLQHHTIVSVRLLIYI